MTNGTCLYRNTRRIQPEEMFKVVLECSDVEGFGLILGAASSMAGLVVVEIKQGSATSRWNDTAADRIELSHVIREVNGITEPQAMLREFARVRRVEMLVDPEPTHLHSSIFRASVMLRKRTHAVDLLLQDVTAPVPVETCAICHDDMTGHDEAHPEVRLPCGHRYHRKCVNTWFSSGRFRCPLCNHNLAEDLVAQESRGS
mmetsp:Transcript_15819/g.17205  ORF Transcript_15819/g.17205 Transcript_15819/m.17205 type:complete len:201 (+) Transcript_15819:2-604(+)